MLRVYEMKLGTQIKIHVTTRALRNSKIKTVSRACHSYLESEVDSKITMLLRL
jgi:ribosomal protein L28